MKTKLNRIAALVLAMLLLACVPSALAEGVSTPTDISPLQDEYLIPEDATLAWSAVDELNPDRRIEIYISWEGETLQLGDRVTLTAVLYGYENTQHSLQWQCAPDGKSWSDIDGAVKSALSFVLTEENVDFSWRMNVCITGIYVEE